MNTLKKYIADMIDSSTTCGYSPTEIEAELYALVVVAEAVLLKPVAAARWKPTVEAVRAERRGSRDVWFGSPANGIGPVHGKLEAVADVRHGMAVVWERVAADAGLEPDHPAASRIFAEADWFRGAHEWEAALYAAVACLGHEVGRLEPRAAVRIYREEIRRTVPHSQGALDVMFADRVDGGGRSPRFLEEEPAADASVDDVVQGIREVLRRLGIELPAV